MKNGDLAWAEHEGHLVQVALGQPVVRWPDGKPIGWIAVITTPGPLSLRPVFLSTVFDNPEDVARHMLIS